MKHKLAWQKFTIQRKVCLGRNTAGHTGFLQKAIEVAPAPCTKRGM